MSEATDPTREQLLLLYNNTSDLVFLIEVLGDSRYRVVSVNRSYLERTQLEPSDIVGRPIGEVLHDQQLAYVTEHYDAAVAQGGPLRYETRTVLRGESIYLDTMLVPVFDTSGRCTHLVGVSREITRNKLERKALEREKQRAENYLNIAEAVILALDVNGNITLLNRKGYAMLGYPEGTLTGKNWCDLFIAPDKADKYRRNYRRAMQSGDAGSSVNVNYVRTRSGERILISWANAIIYDDEGRIAGMLSSGEDITDRRRAEQAMIASQRVLAAEEVVSAVAHDINNSLQGILGNIELALAKADEPEVQRHLETASKLADDAARRVKVLRGAAGREEDGDFEALNLHELIEDVIEQTLPLWKDEAQRHGHSVTLTRAFSRELQPTLGNRSELRSVLYNVVKNSVEAITGHGEVHFRTRFHNGWNVIEVTDSGAGMDSETSTRIFQPFFSTKGLESGRGLGMSASHSIVRAHHGEIGVKRSAPGAGTTIEIRLPAVADAARPGTDTPAEPGHRHHHILWIDDDETIRALAENYIVALGHDGDVVESGQRALALLERNDYSVVITDVGMPDMSGVELAEQVGRVTAGRMPVIALTGWGESITAGSELPEGLCRVIAKPVRLQRLKDVLAELPARPVQVE